MSVGAPRIVADPDQRRAAGLDHWIDGTLGIVTVGSQQLAIAPNGRNFSTHHAAKDLVAGTIATSVELTNPVVVADHVSGGPIYALDDSTFIVMYHAERFVDGDATRFTSWIGMAVTRDWGRTIVDLGPALDPAWDDPCTPKDLIDVGPGAIVALGEWLYLYYCERDIERSPLPLGVARCHLDDLRSAVDAGVAPAMWKWDGADWAAPGLGGIGATLIDDRVLWFDIASIPGAVVLFSSEADLIDGAPMWWLSVRTSTDGVVWSERIEVPGSRTRREQLYVSAVQHHPSGGTSGDESIELYRVRAVPGRRWETATVEVVDVKISRLTSSHPEHRR